MTTETTQDAPAVPWCGNPDHAEAGSAIPAAYLVTWPDGRFKPSADCRYCLEDALHAYVLSSDEDGRLHPVLIELAGSSPVTDELAKLRNACKHMGSVIVSMSRQMECARIEMLQNGPERAMQWILNGLPDVDDNPPGMRWDGKESADEWFERTADYARSEAAK